jgi:hypothetical protein
MTRQVLVVVPDEAAVAGLLDAVSLVAADRRVRVAFTVTPNDSGVEEFLRARGCVVVREPRREFDLVLTAGPRMPHGMRLLFSHCIDVESVAGDMCYDLLLASIPFRAGYRCAFGLSRWERLVVVSGPEVSGQLLSGLPRGRYRVVPVATLGDGWRAALVAADLVVGDLGPITRYGAAIGLPVLLAPHSRDPRPGDAEELLSRHARRLCRDRPLTAQVDAAMRADRSWQDELAGRITARPGQADEILRRVVYRTLGLTEPAMEVHCFPVAPRQIVSR